MLARVNRAPKTVNNALTVLSVLLKKAVEWDAIERVPCMIRLVRAPKPSMGFYDFDEYERLLETAKDLGPTAHLVVLLGGEAGLRCGEMIGLEWGDVDLVKRQMCIQRSEWRGHVTVPKAGRLRYVPMTARLASALRDHRHLKRAIQELAGHQDLTTTQRYMHLSPAALEGAIRLLERGDILETAEQRSTKSLS